jgi:hypothetical protein
MVRRAGEVYQSVRGPGRIDPRGTAWCCGAAACAEGRAAELDGGAVETVLAAACHCGAGRAGLPDIARGRDALATWAPVELRSQRR